MQLLLSVCYEINNTLLVETLYEINLEKKTCFCEYMTCEQIPIKWLKCWEIWKLYQHDQLFVGCLILP